MIKRRGGRRGDGIGDRLLETTFFGLPLLLFGFLAFTYSISAAFSFPDLLFAAAASFVAKFSTFLRLPSLIV